MRSRPTAEPLMQKRPWERRRSRPVHGSRQLSALPALLRGRGMPRAPRVWSPGPAHGGMLRRNLLCPTSISGLLTACPPPGDGSCPARLGSCRCRLRSSALPLRLPGGRVGSSWDPQRAVPAGASLLGTSARCQPRTPVPCSAEQCCGGARSCHPLPGC